MAYNSYDINFYRLGEWLTPRWLRKETFLIILKACLYPLVLIHNAFIRYRDAKIYEINMNYQVCYLEAFLNDRFDFTQRRIYIEDADTEEGTFLYMRAEDNPVYLFLRSEDDPAYLFLRGETGGDLSYDFIVWVPVGLVFDQDEMRAMIATKLCGKRYTIQLF
ncbi:MAG: hypothetical protein ACT4OJ_08840 [Bacteroidota bacterium]